jgi:hypothetical protein
MKIIIHTERIIPNDDYLKDWFESMRNTAIPRDLLNQLRETNQATWESHNCKTTYEIEKSK